MKRRKMMTGKCDLFQYMDAIVQYKKESGQSGTANVYRAVRNRFAAFCDNKPMAIQHLDISVVESFKDYLQSCQMSVNTISNYLSTLRSVYNRGVEEFQIKSCENPFRKMKLHPISTHKRAIPMNVIMELTYLNLKEERLILDRDIFLFSFMACGISFIDLANLTRANIVDDVLIYSRTKTKIEIRISITAGMRCLLDRYADKDSNYLFPILKGGETYEQYKAALRTYNRRLDEIGNLLPFPVKLTSYVARHSWAMQAKEKEVSIFVIGEALGHTSEKTTRFYLSNLDQSVLTKANQKITIRLDKWILKTSTTTGCTDEISMI